MPAGWGDGCGQGEEKGGGGGRHVRSLEGRAKELRLPLEAGGVGAFRERVGGDKVTRATVTLFPPLSPAEAAG